MPTSRFQTLSRHSVHALTIAFLGPLLSPVLAKAEITATPKAIELAQKLLIVDGHVDVPYRVHDQWADITQETGSGDFDYPRAKRGGLDAPFMSIYIPAVYDGTDQATQHAHLAIDYVEALVGRAPDKFAIAKSPNDVFEQKSRGLISLPLGMENGSPIAGEIGNLEIFYFRGIRYITLTHAKSNHISDSSYDDNKRWGGLSPFGKTLIKEMNKLGMMVDISHVSDEAFFDVMELSEAPVIASHSSMRTFTPGFERNMSDKMVEALAKNGGVIMINFGSTFLTKEARTWSDTRSAEKKKIENEYGADSPQAIEFNSRYGEANPFPFATVNHVLDHIDYAVKLVGIDHVGLGSDFDGVGDSLPVGLKDASDLPNLVQGLLDRNYSLGDIEKILSGNVIRVWRDVEDFARKS